MKCSIGFLLIAFGAFQMISAWPVGSGSMVLYQPDYYRHRAFVMHYASQPVKSYHRRQGQAATSLYAAGKKISTGSYVGNVDDEDAENDYQESQEQPSRTPAHSTSIAVAGQQGSSHEAENDAPESFNTQENNNVQPSRDEEHFEDEEEQIPTRSRVKAKGDPANGVTYFPINFGGNPGVVAIANSYSTGKGGSASSRATAYGAPSSSKSKKKLNS